MLRVWGLNFEEFLAKVSRVFGESLADFDRKEAGFDRNSGRSRFRGVSPLGAPRFGHVSGCLGPALVEGSRSGHPEAGFGLLRRHALVTFRAVLSGSKSLCPKGADRALLQEARRD